MSSVRVNPYPMPDLLTALEKLQQQQTSDTLELGTGSKINKPSDDPAGAAQMILMQDTGSQIDSYNQSIGSVNGQLSTADSTLNSVVTVLQRAIGLATEGANGTLSDTDRQAIADELSGIQSELISLANTSYQGRYLFSGTADSLPFVADQAAQSGVTYKGNAGTNVVAIGTGYQIQVNVPGSQVFNGSGTDVFQSIHDLISALNSNSGIADAASQVTNAYNYVTAQRVFYGNAMNQVQTQQSFLSTEKVTLAQQENTTAGADMTQVASDLSAGETAMNAAMQAISSMPRTSLFDYLK